MTHAREVSETILARFHAQPADRLALLRLAADTAAETGSHLYWVGGGVRDLWLGRSELDLDLVIDGDFEPFAARLAGRLGSALHFHPRFMTAELGAPGDLRIDLARARTESYTTPATLPVVESGSVESDLGRRDFTVNCLAIPLEPSFGKHLMDPQCGVFDLERRLLRTLHSASFRDDPTRILRGVEFAARLGFEFAPETGAQVAEAISSGVLALLSPARLGDAFRRALGRPASASAVLRRIRELRLLEGVAAGPGRASSASSAAGRFDAAVLEHAAWKAGRGSAMRSGGRDEGTFSLALLCLALDYSSADRAGLARALALSPAERELLTRGPEKIEAAASMLAGDPRPSAVHAVLGRLTDEELAVIASYGVRERAWVGRERSEMREVRLAISGRDLMASGVAAGRALGRALERTLAAKLDGQIGSLGELAFALGALSGGTAEEAASPGETGDRSR